MRLPISSEMAYWYATRLCEFVNLKLRADFWRSLFENAPHDNAYKEFQNAVERIARKAFLTVRKSPEALRLWQETVCERFSPPTGDLEYTFAGVEDVQVRFRDFLEEASVAAQKVREAVEQETSPLDLSPFQDLTSLSHPISPDIGTSHDRKGNLSLVIGTLDLVSELFLLLSLTLGADVKKCECSCGRFFAVRSKHETIYYSPKCAQSLTGATRVGKYRERQSRWKKAAERLGQRLSEVNKIKRKQRLQQPHTKQQILEGAIQALEDAKKTFTTTYSRNKGKGYEEGKTFLAQADKQIKGFRKEVKGY